MLEGSGENIWFDRTELLPGNNQQTRYNWFKKMVLNGEGSFKTK